MNVHDAGPLAGGDDAFARTPRPPYYAVIFTSRRTSGDPGYHMAAARMADLAAQRRGDPGVEPVRDAPGVGMTVPYRGGADALALAHRRRGIEHAAARERGRNGWYGHYELRVAKAERAYGKKHTA